MTELELENLETKISQLIESLQKLKLENSSLNKKIASLYSENIELLEKQKTASESIKKLILKLQDELICQTKR